MNAIQTQDLRKTILSLKPELEDKLATLVGHASVSMEPQHRQDVQTCAETSATFLEAEGMKAQVLQLILT